MAITTPPSSFKTQATSHGAEQTRPQIDGKGFFSLILSYADVTCPSRRKRIKAGMSMPRGQSFTQTGSGHCGQRLASSEASFLENPRETSLKFLIRFSLD